LAGADPKTAFAKGRLLDELKKAFAERALNAEIDHHRDKGEEDGRSERLWPKIGFRRDQQDRA
jgi:putative transposase